MPPILAMTANAMKEEVARCMEAAMNGYIPKPFKRMELLGTIQKALYTQSLHGPLRQ